MPKIISVSHLFEPDYVKKIFQKNLPARYHDWAGLKGLKIYPIKKQLGKNFEHGVICYSLFLTTKSGVKRKILLFASAHSSGSRKKVFAILKFIYRQRLSNQKPLFYDPATQAMFYEGVVGDNLLHYIQKGERLEHFLKIVAAKIAQIHRLRPPAKLNLDKFSINKKHLDPTGILQNKKITLAKEKREALRLIELTKKYFTLLNIAKHQKYFVQGDCHPGNIIISRDKKKVDIIDFSDAQRSDFAQDPGSFLQQLKFMAREFYTPKKIKEYQKIFITQYLKSAKIKISHDLKNRLLFFQLWVAVKSAIYFLFLFSLGLEKQSNINLLFKQAHKILKRIKI